ncbi:hypothetical protein IB237_23190 [Agrobacterium sp. AGB01]|uniref:hypothetical protein n=1 Tax=Agrobacterium sp. AGB01 TaxID=2769302 RepID=UPI00177E2D8D|nr:hypothetical protein [Agrobacterium sp. AGB01]MBD9390109.1 hypothetical protein [Agrobacterium sp. AGB01]
MSPQLYDLMVEIHRRSAASFDGVCTFNNISITDEEQELFNEAQAMGFINFEIKDDFGDYYILSLTPKGRTEFNLPEVKRKSFWHWLIGLVSPGITQPSQ